VSDDVPALLVIGGGGLLGSAVRRRCRLEGIELVPVAPPWDDPAQASAVLRDAAIEMVGRPRWAAAWCAGVGTVGASAEDLEVEQQVFGRFLDDLTGLVSGAASGALFVASSAGALYAGSTRPPFTESTPPIPQSPYGHSKVEIEALASAFAERSGVPVLIGRITNLYGPGQDLSKPQGVISHLCRSNATRQALSVYVSLDTLRDYLFVDDAASMIVEALCTLHDRPPGPGHGAIVKILASHQPATLGAVLGEFRRVIKRRPLIALGTSSGPPQPLDLRVRSEVWPELDRLATTPLASGLWTTAQDIAERLRRRTTL
jgi:UDP-glucose 4-epimerase